MKRQILVCLAMMALSSLASTVLAQCPNIVGTWTGTVSTVSLSGYSSDKAYEVHVVDQENCLFRGFSVKNSTSTNNFVGGLQVNQVKKTLFDMTLAWEGDTTTGTAVPHFTGSGLVNPKVKQIQRFTVVGAGCDDCGYDDFVRFGTLTKVSSSP